MGWWWQGWRRALLMRVRGLGPGGSRAPTQQIQSFELSRHSVRLSWTLWHREFDDSHCSSNGAKAAVCQLGAPIQHTHMAEKSFMGPVSVSGFIPSFSVVSVFCFAVRFQCRFQSGFIVLVSKPFHRSGFRVGFKAGSMSAKWPGFKFDFQGLLRHWHLS